MKNKIIEYADSFRAGDRIVAASGSLRSWYNRRHGELVKRHVNLKLQAAKESNPNSRKDIDNQAKEVMGKINRLEEAMRTCRLANLDSDTRGNSFFSTIEKRITTTTSPVPAIEDTKDSKSPQGQKKLTGVAAVYGVWTTIGNYFKEQLARGAFSEVIKTCDCRFLFNHDSNYIFGRTINNSCRLYNTNFGLAFWNDLLQNDQASDSLFARIKRRDISGCSFAFIVKKDDWELPNRPGELPKRTIVEIGELFDCGPVTYPAYRDTNIFATVARQKSFGEILEEIYDEEDAEFDRNDRLEKLQKRLDASPTFEQKFSLGKSQRKAERLRNRLELT